MKNILLLALALLAQTAQAQQSFGKVIAGFEVAFDVNQFTDGLKPRLIPGLQLEVPIGPFSIGAGIGTEIYRDYEYYTYAGQTIQRMEGGQVVPYYVSNLNAFRPAYWTVPVKLDFRFHRCNCVYVQAGMSFDFFNDNPEGRVVFEGAELRERPLDAVSREILFKKNTKSYTFGVGFSLFTHRFIRFTARPSFVLSENPEIFTRAPKYISTLRMHFGVQVGLFQ